MRYMPVHLILDLFSLVTFGELYKFSAQKPVVSNQKDKVKVVPVI